MVEREVAPPVVLGARGLAKSTTTQPTEKSPELDTLSNYSQYATTDFFQLFSPFNLLDNNFN